MFTFLTKNINSRKPRHTRADGMLGSREKREKLDPLDPGTEKQTLNEKSSLLRALLFCVEKNFLSNDFNVDFLIYAKELLFKMIYFDITGGSVKVDDEFSWLQDFRWHVNKQGYAVHFVNRGDSNFWGVEPKKAIYMHRLIAGAGDGGVVDHINHNKLDNRSENLRNCSQKENLQNQQSRRRFKGVFYLKGRKKCWQSAIVVNEKKQFLGDFYSQEEAAKAYNEAAVEYFGEFACLNEVA